MAWTQQDIDTLKTAMAQGGAVKSVTFADQTLTFRSLEEMNQLLGQMQREVNAAAPQRRRFAAFTKQ